MGNRKKIKDNRLRLKKNPSILSRGIARLREEDRGVPTHDEPFGMIMPEDESAVIKEVPAQVDGIVVGVAMIHDDGTIAIKFNDDAPQEAMDKIKAAEKKYGYSLETGSPALFLGEEGGPDGPPKEA